MFHPDDAKKGRENMSVTIAEFTRNPALYLGKTATEDVLITRDGVIIARLTNDNRKRVAAVKSLLGALPATLTEDEAREERLNAL